MKVEQKLQEMGLTLPEPTSGVASFIPSVQVDRLLYVSGNTGARMDEQLCRVSQYRTVEQGYEAAEFAMVAALASVKAALGDLDRVERVVKLLGFVNAPEGFTESPQVVNGASDLLIELYGEMGKHARSAIGSAARPVNAPGDVEVILRAKD